MTWRTPDEPGSGFRFRTEQTITVLDESHPVTEGVDPSFDIVDEAYLYPVLEDRVTPLLRSDYAFSPENFPMGGVGFERHPRGSNLVGWTKHAYRSPIAYLQGGHGPEAYANPSYRKLLANAVRWTASAGAATRP